MSDPNPHGQSEVCGVRPSGFADGVRCDLPEHHNSKHSWNGGEVMWEATYVGELRRQRAEIRSALRDAIDLLERPPSEWDDDDRRTFKWLKTVDGSLDAIPA